MTISTTTNKVQYSGNGITTAFAFSYLFYEDSDLEVIITEADGTETTQTITTNYTVTGAENPLGGTVTMIVPPASGETLTIVRVVPQTQTTDLVNNDAFDAEVMEKRLDLLTMMVQRLNQQVNQKIGVSDGATFSTVTLDLLGVPIVNLGDGDSEGASAALNAGEIDTRIANAITGNPSTTVYALQSDIVENGSFYIDSGSADTYQLDTTDGREAPLAYGTGMRIEFQPTNANTGASTVNVEGLGAKTLTMEDGSTALASGFLDTGYVYRFVYTGTVFKYLGIADNTVTLAKMAGGTAGSVIGYDDSGDPEEKTFNQWVTLNTHTVSGTEASIAFTSIPSSATEIHIAGRTTSVDVADIIDMVVGVGATPTYVTSSYLGAASQTNGASTLWATSAASLQGVAITAAQNIMFDLTLVKQESNMWYIKATAQGESYSYGYQVASGSVNAGAALSAIKLDLKSGNNFDSGVITCRYYGNPDV